MISIMEMFSESPATRWENIKQPNDKIRKMESISKEREKCQQVLVYVEEQDCKIQAREVASDRSVEEVGVPGEGR